MTRARPRSILWVDDQMDGLQPFVAALRDAGFDVTDASSFDEAMAAARARRYDIILVDIRMPPPDGIELVRQLRPIQKRASLAVLSSYLYLDIYRSRLQQLNFPVQLMDKDIPNVEASDFAVRFIDPIKELAERGVTQTIETQEAGLQQPAEIDPFEIPLSEFMRKPILEKDRLVDIASKVASGTIKRAFAEGKIWILLCGSKGQIRASASSPHEILSEDQIMEFARVQERPPFQFFAPAEVEDMWLDCGSGSYLQNYPTVTLDFGKEGLSVHFDTGAPMTYFSYEELLRLGAIRPTSNWGKAWRGDKEYRSVSLNIEVLLRCQATDQTRSVRLRGQAVRDWPNSPFARYCTDSCEFAPDAPNSSTRRLCPLRAGLIGRNLLIENQVVLILDGTQHKTRLDQ